MGEIMNKPRLAVFVNGGIVTDFISDIDLDIVVFDHDIQGVDKSRLYLIHRNKEIEEEVSIEKHSISSDNFTGIEKFFTEKERDVITIKYDINRTVSVINEKKYSILPCCDCKNRGIITSVKSEIETSPGNTISWIEYRIMCINCDVKSEAGITIEEAIDNWNKMKYL